MAFASGRYSIQSPTTKITTTTHTTTQQDQVKDTHTQTTITVLKTPDGTVKTTKIIDQVADVKTDTTKVQDKKSLDISIPPKTNTLNISALVANDFSRGLLVPTYGASVTKEILGPITIGGFGLTNGTIGVSIGLNF